ncbi:MAG: glycosyl transferase family 2 [Flavipsychrobacter sp.]|jgi:glycosyltransferase involved in cell wall biosynthesis|nr:glycosyl transferase family 2 [Flavipsychrobacter sp.]
MSEAYFFKDVTLLITHYNRNKYLERLLASLAKLNCSFEEIIVSDDASRPEVLKEILKLQQEYGFRLLTTWQNKGVGNCINKGMDAVSTLYTLYIQEDFIPLDSFPQHFGDALQIMNDDQTIDYIRFWAIEKPRMSLKPHKKGFSEMVHKFWNMNHLKFYQYSDTPNIRRRNFAQKFGRYREGVHGDTSDYLMAISFLHHKGKGLFYNAYSSLFLHDDKEEGSRIRPLITWRQKRNPVTIILRFMFLRYKWLKGTWLVWTFGKDK